MAKRVGIPRGLFYYQYYPFWKTFLEELGAELVVSDHTTKKILDDGVKNCVDEACLPIKLFHGHVMNLKDRVDCLLIPRFTSISKNEYVCPKFGGLPDMIRHTLKELPPVIDTEVNLRKSRNNSIKAALELGMNFSNDKSIIKAAYKKAVKDYKGYMSQLKAGILPTDILDKRLKLLKKPSGKMLNIAVIGHMYNLYDSYTNMDMIRKLQANHINIITVDMIDEEIINEKANTLNKRIFWYFGRKAMGTALHLLEREDIDGIMYVMSFGCGIDSFVCDLIERKIRRNRNIPFIVLTIDEHSGEAGLNTRLEAFIDMIRWRNADESNISTFG
jgi:predicted nucleotide-binding protein (sugar kinase/HSP70/actin superfamily)